MARRVRRLDRRALAFTRRCPARKIATRWFLASPQHRAGALYGSAITPSFPSRKRNLYLNGDGLSHQHPSGCITVVRHSGAASARCTLRLVHLAERAERLNARGGALLRQQATWKLSPMLIESRKSGLRVDRRGARCSHAKASRPLRLSRPPNVPRRAHVSRPRVGLVARGVSERSAAKISAPATPIATIAAVAFAIVPLAAAEAVDGRVMPWVPGLPGCGSNA